MKKIALIFSVLFCLASCEKQGTNYGTQGESGTIYNDNNNNDNNNNDNNNSLILGVWEINNIYNYVATEGYLSTTTNQPIETNVENWTSQFNNINNIFWEFISTNIFIEYEPDACGNFYIDTISYTLNGDDLLVNYSNNEQIDYWKINSLSNNVMDVSIIMYDEWSSGDTIYFDRYTCEVIFNKSQLPQLKDSRSIKITNKKEKSIYIK